ncbi:carboxymuconolactone decarboxylase family protein [Arthrobacter sp. ZBG10]|uniref:carboxymuconolactone decarboxylase family protein n=1 Tax=Arthrobacter sp. ZBG10 TaxID=1676590 RepID=UPI0009E32C0B
MTSVNRRIQTRQLGGGRKMFGEFAPKLAEVTDDVLFEDVWNRVELGARDRSLITVAVLTAGGNTDQLRFHLSRAIENGVSQEELIEAITHVTFYAGWPRGMSAMCVAKELLVGPLCCLAEELSTRWCRDERAARPLRCVPCASLQPMWRGG